MIRREFLGLIGCLPFFQFSKFGSEIRNQDKYVINIEHLDKHSDQLYYYINEPQNDLIVPPYKAKHSVNWEINNFTSQLEKYCAKDNNQYIYCIVYNDGFISLLGSPSPMKRIRGWAQNRKWSK